jgi:hypothetical protein
VPEQTQVPTTATQTAVRARGFRVQPSPSRESHPRILQFGITRTLILMARAITHCGTIWRSGVRATARAEIVAIGGVGLELRYTRNDQASVRRIFADRTELLRDSGDRSVRAGGSGLVRQANDRHYAAILFSGPPVRLTSCSVGVDASADLPAGPCVHARFEDDVRPPRWRWRVARVPEQAGSV